MFTALTSFLPGVVFAETLNLKPGGFAENVQDANFNNLLAAVINLVLIVSALIFFFMLLWGGLQWILSGGDKGKTESARNTITAALIGLVIVFSAWAILNFAATFIGVDIDDLTLPTLEGGGAGGGGGGS